MQLALKDCVALDQLGIAPLVRIQLGLAADFLRIEPACAARLELPPPRRQQRAVDAFLPKHGLDRSTLAAGEAGVGLLHDPQLVRGAEYAPRTSRRRFYSCAAGAERALALLARGCIITNWNLGLWQGIGSILRPSALTFPGGAVSDHVGTGGAAASPSVVSGPTALGKKLAGTTPSTAQMKRLKTGE